MSDGLTSPIHFLRMLHMLKLFLENMGAGRVDLKSKVTPMLVSITCCFGQTIKKCYHVQLLLPSSNMYMDSWHIFSPFLEETGQHPLGLIQPRHLTLPAFLDSILLYSVIALLSTSIHYCVFKAGFWSALTWFVWIQACHTKISFKNIQLDNDSYKISAKSRPIREHRSS